ncbi:AMP-binding protein [Amycolatopsis sp. NPDC049868]|uniref:AMP-binding protein n=1 Tax=Amycolatopsis sp. NPDC049868 TaxID=3363934 RepID=UPI0037874B6F
MPKTAMKISVNESFIADAMEWHFAPETGSKFWLEKQRVLEFDPRRDVRTHADLRLFPNVVDELRYTPIADLIPRGYGSCPDIVGVYDSGGTTGASKRVPLYAEWLKSYVAWTSRRMDVLGFPAGGNWLAVTPTGPHVFGRIIAELVRHRRGVHFTIDLDPRWVKRSLREKRDAEASRYIDHLIEQTVSILEWQPIDVLVVPPPLLERMVAQEDIADLIRRKVSAVLWGGAHLDPDSRQLLRTEVLPRVGIHGMYGSTTILGGAMERPGKPAGLQCVFDPFSPAMSFSVVDPQTLEEVADGERGQVVMHHISRSLLLPNNLERDLATRIAAPAGTMGASVADVAPMPSFADTEVIEGVY